MNLIIRRGMNVNKDRSLSAFVGDLSIVERYAGHCERAKVRATDGSPGFVSSSDLAGMSNRASAERATK